MANYKQLYLKTIANDLMEGLDPRVESVSIFNYKNGTKKYDLSKKTKSKIVSQETSWIRVMIRDGVSYDFIANSVTIFDIDDTLVILCSGDAQFIDYRYIVDKIYEVTDIKGNEQSLSTNVRLEEYYRISQSTIKERIKEIEKKYLILADSNASRLNKLDSFEQSKKELERINMLDVMINQIIKENESEIFELL